MTTRDAPERRVSDPLGHDDSGATDDTLPGPVQRDEAPPSAGEMVVRRRIAADLFGGPPPRIGRYSLLGAHGSGGMGTVFAAYDDKLDRKIAIKVLHGTGPTAAQRLVAEARALARVVHPNVVAVHDVVEEGDRVYVAMEFVRGVDLRHWLQTPRGWREVVDVFLQAGRGLAAVHAAGILHRDFKPDNAIVGDDGSVRVVDFGLALTSDVTESDVDAAGTGDVDATMREGRIVGTLPYMPLEQLEGGRVDERSDQFSFCVSLFEGLYGQRPFEGSHVFELCDAIDRQQIVEVASPRDVPRWLRAVVARGLARDPEDRWPSMAALLDAIERRARPARRMWILGVAATGGGAIVAMALAKQDAPSCDGGAATIAADLSDDARSRAAQAFATAAPSYGADAWTRVDQALAAFSEQWTERHRFYCEATHVRHELSAERLDVRMMCLQRRWRRVTTLMDVFANADAQIVEDALSAVRAMPAPETCDEDEDEDAVPAELAADVQEIDLQIEDSAALQAAGQRTESRDLAARALHDAEQLDYTPLRARAGARLGAALMGLEDYAAARERLRDAYLDAQASGLDDLAAVAANDLASAFAKGDRALDVALAWADVATASLRRLKDRAAPERWATNERVRAAAYYVVGKSDEAIERMGKALALEESSSTDRLGLATSHNNYAVMLNAAGRTKEALVHARKALAIRDELQGPDHPLTLHTTIGMVTMLGSAGEEKEAEALADELYTRVPAALGPEHPYVIDMLNLRAALFSRIDRVDEALADQQRALDLLAASDPDSLRAGKILTNRAFVLRREGRPEEAARDLEEALRIYEARAPNDKYSIATIVGNLGNARLSLGDHDAAIVRLERARELLVHDASRATLLVRTENNLSNALDAAGRHADALAVLDVALQRALALDPPDREEVGRVRRNRGRTLLALGRADEARDTLALALEELDAEATEPTVLAETCRNMAQAEAARGAPDAEVQVWVERALAHFEKAPPLAKPEADALRRWWEARKRR